MSIFSDYTALCAELAKVEAELVATTTNHDNRLTITAHPKGIRLECSNGATYIPVRASLYLTIDQALFFAEYVERLFRTGRTEEQRAKLDLIKTWSKKMFENDL